MAAYLGAYADEYGLRDSIRFWTAVDRLEAAAEGGWSVTLDDGSRRRYDAVVLATGLFWSPRVPAPPGSFDGTVVHAREYRTPEPYAGRRVLVVGAGQSAAEIAVEVSAVAERTFMSIRRGVHVIPRWIGRRPYDAADVAPLNRMPWRLLNALYGVRVGRALGPRPASWPRPGHRLVEGIPIVSSELLPAVRRGDIVVKPATDRLDGDSVRFADGSTERIDRIVYATGYRISVPYLSPSLLASEDRTLPLYRRIVPPASPGLYFAGFVDAPGGLLPVVETQGQWIAAAIAGRLRLPSPERMWQALERPERRTRRRFPDESALSVRCDPHAHRRQLHADLRRANRRALRGRAGRSARGR
jgi:hypothetical protein